DAASAFPLLLAKARRALFDEGVTAFLGLGRAVVELEGGEGDFGDAGDVLGVGVEGLLRELERRRALFEDLFAPLRGFGAEICRWNDGVHQAHLERLGRRVLATEVPDLACLLLADEPREVGGA